MDVYRELEARPSLREHLSCVWYRIVPPGDVPRPGRVLPDACIDIVWPAGRAPFVAGPDTGPVLNALDPGAVIVGARFRPGRGPELLGVAAHELRDAQPPLAGLWGEAPARRLRESTAAGSAPDMLDAVQREIEGRLGAGAAPDAVAPAALAWARGRGPLDRLGGALDLGDRQLLRRVEERFGYGPAVLRRVLRLQRLLAMAARPPRRQLADLALAAGYADQAHMSRECRRLTGLSPARLLAEWLPSAR